jgi:hypothetical protein
MMYLSAANEDGLVDGRGLVNPQVAPQFFLIRTRLPGFVTARSHVGPISGMSGRCYYGLNYRGRIALVKVDKLSVSFDPELGDAVRSAAAQAGKPLSSWLAEAAASKLRAEALAEFLDGWEAEHGVLTAEELARAERELGMAASDSAA